MTTTATHTKIAGPTFQLVDEVAWHDRERSGHFGPRPTPLLVKGAVRPWPAWDQWSFEKLAQLRRPDGGEVVTRFASGLIEQGVTRELLELPVSNYLSELADAARQSSDVEGGLLSDHQRQSIAPGDSFRLDWSYMKSFTPNRLYLSQWDILKEFPSLRRDFAIRQLWPGWRWTWEYVFLGPANTVTGFHCDLPNNWFCQVKGVKEVLLVPPEHSHHMCPSQKYDWGATLSHIDICHLEEQPRELAEFEKTQCLYARVEAGDALFIPRGTWHAVVALEPSISLAVFGLTPVEILIGGGVETLKNVLHLVRLYRWGNCTCHVANLP